MNTRVTKIRPGHPSDYVEATSLLYESSHELMDFMLGNRATAERVIGNLYRKKQGHFSYRFSTTALLNGQVVGIELGYDKAQLAKQDLIGGVLLFLSSPVARWWHFLTTVNGIVASYVPKPGDDAYYINNIAVSLECRGTGIGKLLLLDTLDRARQKNYDCVELDVTSVNEHAIKFYEKAGFVAVSESGSDALHDKHGLPSLIRMRFDI